MGIEKFGWRRQLLLSRQELVQRLEERLKPPEGVDWIQIHSQIHSSTVTPDKVASVPRPDGNSSQSQTPPPTARATGASAQSPRTVPSSSDLRSPLNGSGVLPPPITRRIAFDPTFLPTPLSQAHSRRIAASALEASPPQKPNLAQSSTGGGPARANTPKRLARATSGLRTHSPRTRSP